MTRVDIERDLIKSFGACWGNKKQLAQYLGVSRNNEQLTEATKNLPHIGQGYSAKDLSERLYEMQKF